MTSSNQDSTTKKKEGEPTAVTPSQSPPLASDKKSSDPTTGSKASTAIHTGATAAISDEVLSLVRESLGVAPNAKQVQDSNVIVPLNASPLDDFAANDFEIDETVFVAGSDRLVSATSGRDSPHGGATSPEGSDQIVLGEYLIESVLGAGGMGQVFRAKHRTMDRWVALKVLPDKLAGKRELVDRFYSEIRAVGKLMHPNIVTAFDAGCHEGVHYLVMELIEGNLLSTLVSQDGPMTTEQVVNVLAQAASALDYAHSLGIIHRDIKPSNMMLTHSGVLKILDFGLARLNQEAHELERDSKRQLMGTVEYMSPEQINAPETIDHRSDLYSLGATLFFLLTGRPMFQGEAVQTALAQVRSKPSPLYEVRGDIDLRLDSIFQKLVAKSPTDRFATGGMMLESMHALNLVQPKQQAYLQRDRAAITRLSVLTREHSTDGFRSQSTSLKKYNAIGIELGMLQSRVSFIDAKHVLNEVVLDGIKKSMPNMLWGEPNRLAIGKAANDLRHKAPQHIFHGLQRWFGLVQVERSFCGRQVAPEVLLGTFIRRLANAAESEQRGTTHAVVTVPACYDQLHRNSVVRSCQIAGIEVLQLLEKPLAAAVAHIEMRVGLNVAQSANTPPVTTFLVCELNGTCCEAAVVRAVGRKVECLSAAGDWKRGVLRWQHRVAEYLADYIQTKSNIDVKSDLALSARLQRSVEKIFEQLPLTGNVDFLFEVKSQKIPIQMSIQKLMEIAEEFRDDVVGYAQHALARANLTWDQIDEVLLVGEFLQCAYFPQRLSQLFTKTIPCQLIGQSQLAKGAAIQAQYLLPPGNSKSPYAEASSNYDLGLVVQEEKERPVSPPKILIPKGTPLPASISRTLRFSREHVRQPTLQFVESSRLGGSNWNRLGKIDLETCFPERPPSDPLQLRVDIDSSGIWKASLTWLAKNVTIPISQMADPPMPDESIRQWREWVETLLLCNLQDSAGGI